MEEEKTEEQQSCLGHSVRSDLTGCSEDTTILYQSNLGQDIASVLKYHGFHSPLLLIIDTVFTDDKV